MLKNIRLFQSRSSNRLLAGWLAGVWLAVLFGGLSDVPAQGANGVSDPPGVIQSQTETRTGYLTVIYGDGRPGSGRPAEQLLWLAEDNGRGSRLVLTDAQVRSLGGWRALNGRRVKASGRAAVSANQGQGDPAFQVDSIQPDDTSRSPLSPGSISSGAQPWATILCKFSDFPLEEPKSPAYFDRALNGDYPGLSHYWREASYNAINLDGSATFGWFTLPQPRSYYASDTPGNFYINFGRLTDDCTAVADASLNYSRFSGINLIFNTELDGASWGGVQSLTLDGPLKQFGVTWLPPWGYSNQGVFAHEMGHGFGLSHSADYLDREYNNYWDVMSTPLKDCSSSTQSFGLGCTGQHPIAYQKDGLGWLNSRKFVYTTPGFAATLTLEQLALPQTGSYVMAQVPISGSATHYYTVEARRPVGYDSALTATGGAVIIHEVDTTRSIAAHLIDQFALDGDSSTNPDPAGPGAMWLPGETFRDASGVIIAVISSTATGFVISIGINPLPSVSSLSPALVRAGSPGFNLTVNGSQFAPDAVVSWNGASRPTTYVSSRQVVAAISAADVAAVGTANVQVVNPGPGGGPSIPLSFEITNPIPVITGLTPDLIPVGSAALNLVVTGYNFINGATVQWNGATRPTTINSSTQLTVALSASDFNTAGTASVTVTNPPNNGTSGGVSAARAMAVLSPVITALSPATVVAGTAGITLTVTGSNFVNGTQVYFKGSPRPTTFVNGGQLTAALSTADVAADGSAPVYVVTPALSGGQSNSLAFVILKPVITGLLPAAKQVGSGIFELNVYGRNFASGLRFRWEGVELTPYDITSTGFKVLIDSSRVSTTGVKNLEVVNSAQSVSVGQGFPVYAAGDCAGAWGAVVTRLEDDLNCGSLRYALTQNVSNLVTINILSTTGFDTISLNTALPGPRPGLTIFGGCGPSGPLTILRVSETLPLSTRFLLSLGNATILQGLNLQRIYLTNNAINTNHHLSCIKLQN